MFKALYPNTNSTNLSQWTKQECAHTIICTYPKWKYARLQ